MKIAILTRSKHSVSPLVGKLSELGVAVDLVVEYPRSVELNKKRYKFLERIDINLYRAFRLVFLGERALCPLPKFRTEVVDVLSAENISELLKSNGIELLLLKNSPILKKDFIDSVGVKIINAHSGLLPFYKGASCGFWPVVNGDDLIGVTLHEVTPVLDAGRIIARKQIPLSEVAFRYDYPRQINRLQTHAMANLLNYYLQGSISLEDKFDGPVVKTYYPLPGISKYLVGLFVLFKYKRKSVSYEGK